MGKKLFLMPPDSYMQMKQRREQWRRAMRDTEEVRTRNPGRVMMLRMTIAARSAAMTKPRAFYLTARLKWNAPGPVSNLPRSILVAQACYSARSVPTT
jgi:hypothetical protein